MIYLDNSATTMVEEQTLSVMNEYHCTQYGNPSSLHGMGLDGEKAVNSGRSALAGLLKVKPEEVYFTSGGTESNNTAIRGAVEKRKKRGNRIITSKTEHPSVLEVFRHYETEGWDVVYLDVDAAGQIDMEQLKESLDPQTVLVSILHVNNETGAIQNLKAIGSLVKKVQPNALFHCDCIQSFGKMPVEPHKWQADMISMSAHKMHGPKGLGALYIKKGVQLQPLMFGGGQEKGFRSGTENVAGIAGWDHVMGDLSIEEQQKHFYRLKSAFLEELMAQIPDVQLNSPVSEIFAHHVVSVSFADVRGEVLLHALERKGIYTSTGSACSSKKRGESHVLQQIGLDKRYLEGTLRFSFSKLNTLEEVKEAVPVISKEVQNIRKFIRRR